MNPTRQLPESRTLAIAVTLATLLAFGLRAWNVTGQVVLDDEWHAIHKLMDASYRNIVRTFGLADHSIPLTLLYKAMADTIGLAEGRLRVPQILCGVALVPAGAWLAWRATRDAAAAALFAFLIAGAPFLVMWSRFARPYAIALLFATLCVAAIWRWRTQRTWRWAAWAGLLAALAAWFHLLFGLYPVIACVFVFCEDAAAPRDVRPRPSRQSIALGAAVALAMLVVLAPPLIHDRRALTGKEGGDHPGLEAYDRMLALFWGGLPTPVMWIACLIAAWGAVRLLRRDPRLGIYLLLLAAVPAGIITLLGAKYANAGQALARYVLPLQPLLLFLGALGTIDIARALARRHARAAAWGAAGIASAAYLAATPTVGQVATLGPWYAHIDYHWDYRVRWNAAKRGDRTYDPPAFYRALGRMAPGSAPIIEAPFEWEAPYNALDYYATYYHQPERFGMLHALCRPGDPRGEPPERDRRFRFRLFVFLDDVDAVRNSGARYLLLNRAMPNGKPFPQAQACVDRLAALYGAPVEDDARLAVFDLRRTRPR